MKTSRRSSRPKALIFLFSLLFLSSGLALAEDLWPSSLTLPLFQPAPPLTFSEPTEYDSEPAPYTLTIGEMKAALVYKENYDLLFNFVNDTIVPQANQVGENYNQLVRKYRTLVVVEVVLSLACVGTIGYLIGVSR